MAAAEPSFRISIDSISEGFNEFSPLLENAPSITYKGSVAPNVPAPRTSILISAPASYPPFAILFDSWSPPLQSSCNRMPHLFTQFFWRYCRHRCCQTRIFFEFHNQPPPLHLIVPNPLSELYSHSFPLPN